MNLGEELAYAAKDMPMGHVMVTDGVVKAGDLRWDEMCSVWVPVKAERQARPGRKSSPLARPVDVGCDVRRFTAVCRNPNYLPALLP